MLCHCKVNESKLREQNEYSFVSLAAKVISKGSVFNSVFVAATYYFFNNTLFNNTQYRNRVDSKINLKLFNVLEQMKSHVCEKFHISVNSQIKPWKPVLYF